MDFLKTHFATISIQAQQWTQHLYQKKHKAVIGEAIQAAFDKGWILSNVMTSVMDIFHFLHHAVRTSSDIN